MSVIDIDSHVQEPLGWFDTRFPDLAAQLPKADRSSALARRAEDDMMMESVPRGLRTKPEQNEADVLSSPAPFVRVIATLSGLDRAEALDYIATLSGPEADVAEKWKDVVFAYGGYVPEERIEVLDEMGIDFQFALHSGHEPFVRAMRIDRFDLALEGLAAGNTWSLENFAGYTDRVSPITLVDVTDLDWSLAEIRRTRPLGSRVVQVRTTPIDGKSIAHPDFDVFWSEVVDLGMVVMIHVGAASPLIDPGWSNHGQDPHHTSLLYFSQNAQPAQVALAGLILGGVFERHPSLHVCVAELGFEWLPVWLDGMDRRARPSGPVASFLGQYQFELLPSEYMQRQVHVAAIANNIQRVAPALRDIPDGILAFSSDYPHVEGCGKGAMQLYQRELTDFDAETLNRFYSAGTLGPFLQATA